MDSPPPDRAKFRNIRTWGALFAAFLLAGLLAWSLYPWIYRYASQLPRLSMSRIERERIESGDPGIWDAVSRLRKFPAAQTDILVLWRGPEDWRMIFGFYRINYELFPRRVWFMPGSSFGPARDAFALPADAVLVSGATVLGRNANVLERVPLRMTDAAASKTAVIVSYGQAGGSAFYRVEPGRKSGLNLTRTPSPPAGRRPGPRRAWLWPTGLGSVVLLGLAFGLMSGMSLCAGPGRSSQLSMAFFSGWGIIGFSMAAASLAGAKWSLPLLMAMITAILAFVLYAGMRRGWPGLPPLMQPQARWTGDRIGLALVAAAVAVSVIQAMIPFDPHHNWDTWALWDLKTRACWNERGLPFAYLRNQALHFTHREYPLGIPILQTYLGFWSGGINHVLLRLLSPVFHFSLLAFTAALLAELGIGRGRWLAAGLLGMVPMFLRQAANGGADLPMAAAMLGCLLLAVRAIRGKAPLWCVAWMGGIAASIKEEGLVWAAACLLAAWLGMRRGPAALRRLAAAGLLFAALLIPWKSITAQFGLTSTAREYRLAKIARLAPARIWPVVRAAAIETIGPGVSVGAGVTEIDELVYRPLKKPSAFIKHPAGQWLFLWHFVLVALALNWRRLRTPPHIYVLGVLGIQAAAVTFAYVSTVYDIEWYLAYSLDRVMLQIAPAAFVLALGLFADRRSHPAEPPECR